MTALAASAPTVTLPSQSKALLWTGRAMTTIAVLFLAMDASMKLFKVQQAVEGTLKLGFSPGVIVPLGLIQVAALVLYLIPRTAFLGALVFTGYLGGAVETHVRLGDPLFSHLLFPIYVATLLWGGLVLRDRRFRALL